MTTSKRARIQRGAIVAAIVTAAAACGGGGSSSGSAADNVPLVGTSWALNDDSLGVPMGDTSVSAHFASNTVSGASGCNSYNAAYNVDGNSMTIGPDIATTRRACEAGPTAVEHAYLGQLLKVTSYTIKGSTLSLSGKSGKVLLSFGASTAHDIVGTWTVTGYYTGTAVQSVIVGTSLTADFSATRVSGEGGCNSFSGPTRQPARRSRSVPAVAPNRHRDDTPSTPRETKSKNRCWLCVRCVGFCPRKLENS